MIPRRQYEKYLGHHDRGVFRQIPLPCPGRLYAGPMPYVRTIREYQLVV
jgi:hypothetical protein